MLKESKVFDDGHLDITYTIDAPLESVYSALTESESIKNWMGPEGVFCGDVKQDLKEGGEYEFDMRDESGEHVAFGKYKEIIPNEKLYFTWEWKDGDFHDSEVTVNLSEKDGQTQVSLHHDKLPNKKAGESHCKGLTSSLDKLENYIYRKNA